jgi:glycosyltransferase
MKISIVTVCYNSEKTIADTLESIAKQNYRNMECIIVDGFSTDSTWSIIESKRRSLPRDTELVREKDHGIYDAMNKGIAKSTGDVVGFLNSDDVFADETSVARIADAFKTSACELIYGDLVYTKVSNLSQITRRWKSGFMPRLGLKTGWHPAHPTMYVKREILQRNPFDLDFKIAADYELMVRLLEKHKVTSHYVPYTLVRMREGGASNSGLINILKANNECLRAWSKNRLFANPLTIVFKLARKILQYRARP